jgi:UDP:flavonoid glycosyltransferase YjiC (YdhE family)
MSESRKIVLNTFGSYGDIHPYMAIAIELQERGHEAVVATLPLYREKIEAAGLLFAPVRPDLPPPQDQDEKTMSQIMDPRTGPKFLIEKIVFASVRESYADLVTALKDADLLVTHPATPAGPLVGRKLDIPWISTVLAPMSFFSAYDPPVPPYWRWINKLSLLGPGVMRAVLDLVRRTFDISAVENLQRELGLSEAGHPIGDGQHSPILVLALFSSLFAAAQPDWPAQTKITGFAFYDGHRELEMPAHLIRFLDSGEAPIVFTLGSSAVWVAASFYRESIAATKALGRRAVLLVGDQRNMPAELLPEEITAVDYAPYQSLLPRACAIVHHGGVGTTSQGLRAGVPTLIVPFAFDQPDNADHAARLGISRTLERYEYRAPKVARELHHLLTDPSYADKARKVGAAVSAENGAAKAADLIECVLRNYSNDKLTKQEPAYAASN